MRKDDFYKDSPIVLVKWYDACKWILEKVDNIPKNQRFAPLEMTYVLRLCPTQ